MKRAGQLVIFKFPQTDLLPGKSRLGLLVAKSPGNYDDWLISMVTSRTHQYLEGMDEIIGKGSTDFF